MPEEIKRVILLSGEITMNYVRLSELIIDNKTDTEEFDETLKRIKEILDEEEETYSKINLDTIEGYFKVYSALDDTPIENRVLERLSERKNVILDVPRINDYTTIGSVLGSKIMIDTIKLMEERINSLEKENCTDEGVKLLRIYHKSAMFAHLTYNTYIEKRSLEYNFDIESIPSISFEEINNQFDTSIPNNIQNTIIRHILEDIMSLNDLNQNLPDRIMATYLALFELSRIETMLEYLNKKSLNTIYNIFQTQFTNSKTEPMLMAKELIRKRKEKIN